MSIKQLIVQIIKSMPKDIEILSMKVTKADYTDIHNPLVELVNTVNEKQTAGPENVIIPEKLSIYTKEFDMEAILNGSTGSGFNFDGGTPKGNTALSGPGPHNHGYTTLGTNGAKASLNQFDFTIKKDEKGIITIYNQLKIDDIVTVISFNEGNSYYVLDREVY